MQSNQIEKAIVEEWFYLNQTYFVFMSSKQPVAAKSAGEAELIGHHKVGDLVEWAREFLQDLGYSHEKVLMLVDSTCAMQMVKQGTN